MNKKELVLAMRREGMSGVVVKRIERLVDRYSTIEGFFSASRGSIMSEYAKINTFGKHSLGKSFWISFDKAKSIFRGDSKSEKTMKDAGEPDSEKIDSEKFRMMTLDELKTVVSFMELCDVEAINILEITGFLGAVRMRQKKSPPVPDPGCEGEKDMKIPERE